MKIDQKILQLELEIKKQTPDCFDKNYFQKIEKILDYYIFNRFLQKSIYYAELLKELHEKAERYDHLCGILNCLGKIYSQLQQMDMALDYLQQAQELSQKIGNRKFESMSLTNLGLLLRKMDKLDESLESYFRARKIMEELLQSESEQVDNSLIADYLQVLNQIGVLYNILKQPDKALEYMKLSLHKARESKQIHSVYTTLINLGVFYSERDPDKALEHYQEALTYVKESDDKHIMSVVLNNIGGVYEDKNDLAKALDYYFKALDLVEEYEQKDYILYFSKHIGTVYYKQKRYVEALDYVNKSLALAKKGNHTSEIEENYHLLSKIYRAMDNYRQALEFSDKYIELKERSLNSELQHRVSILKEKYEKTREELKETKQKTSLISDVLQKKMKLDFIGCSPALKKVHKIAMQAANTPNSNILITGESGTGKEIIANVIHYASSRHDNMFISVNSSSIPEHLMESAFLGHIKGAFTGAIADQAGYLKLADKGTLFLDEIGDMPVELQAKLLRVLEYKRFLPVGAAKEIESDFRLITATNKNIETLINENKFRVDLFYRINTIEIRIPPLRERKEDIAPLTEHFLNHYARMMNKPVPKLGTGVIRYLENYPFPGNVRELKNMMERVMITLNKDILCTDDFCPRVNKDFSRKEKDLPLTTLAEMEENMIRKTLELTGFNISKTARILGIHYTTLNRKLKNLKINKEYN